MIHIGFNNMINNNRVIAIADGSNMSAPVRRAVQNAKRNGRLIDLTCGRKTGTVFFMDNSDVVISASSSMTIKKRLERLEDI